jgi:hypothetical protein
MANADDGSELFRLQIVCEMSTKHAHNPTLYLSLLENRLSASPCRLANMNTFSYCMF